MEMQSSSSHHEAPDTSSVPPPPPPSDGAPLQDHALLPQSIEHSVAVQEAEMSEEEVKGTLEAVASTGKFWQDWEKLKGMLSWWLKKVLSEYPEAKITDEQQKEALGETYLQLVNRLDEALLNFDEGPPFTLQRLCEILLAARSIYPKLSKLALALEKNLLVTSMLSISTDPQLETTENANAATEDTGTAAANWAQNGIEEAGGDKDEIMTEVEEADVDDAMTIDMETIDEPSETTTKASESEKPSETNAAEPSSDSMAAEEGDSRLP
ncbi:serine/threonine-protein phosphatase 4 regulatory subunit 2-like isoform X1 [Brassica napus]|uniref:serine/threonine-protein phosphatase 4 regulatory subunit 2-like isoform X1 n=1 Tax=Brassica napus TaxID=3708 RepID=UPI002079005E|nr:serine/threonine-protein phosphatase 4 regulatory subunit 2-like isoform X1 [Brassica napus]